MTEEEWCKRRSKNMLKRILTYYYDDEGKLMNNRPYEEHFISENPYYDNKSEVEKENEDLKNNLDYAKAIMRELLDNSNEYARQNAEDFIKGE